MKFDVEEIYNINCAIEFFNKEFRNFDEKVKTGILATATSFLNQFQEYRSSKIFCPKKEEITILSMDSVIDKGEILLVDIDNDALARSMGTMIKLHYQRSILNRLANPNRKTSHPAFIFGDEYQGLITVGGGNALGDDRFIDKCREANAICILATQSYSSLLNTVKNDNAVNEFIQNFRTKIAFHSEDEKTINNFKMLVGQTEKNKESRSISEIAQRTERNFILGGFDSENANISESVNVSTQKEWVLTGKEFLDLKIFEAWALVFDGVQTSLQKIYTKPNFLSKPNTPHEDILNEAAGIKKVKSWRLLKGFIKKATPFLLAGSTANAFPNICTVIAQPSFRSCMTFTVTPDMCPSPFPLPPHSCARISYFIPQTFIETTTSKGISHFNTLPIAASQLAGVDKTTPFGAVNDDDTQAFQARTIAVPLTQLAFSGMPCGGERQEKLCFDGMSEHIEPHWSTGKGDLMQPAFLAWKASPKLCLLKGAATSIGGGRPSSMGAGSGTCSYPFQVLPVFPPSSMPVCTGWGVMFPRYGTQVGGSEIIGSLSIASRIKSLSVEVFKNMPADPSEKWSMLSPNSSSCFREFENIGGLETIRQANNRGRLVKKNLQGNLFTTWKQVSCKKEWYEVPVYKAELAIIESVCKGMANVD